MGNKSISVVIPNYNGRKLLEQNLPFLFDALRNAGVRYEIIIPDDASTDNSLCYLEQNYPELRLVKNKLNKGFSANINTGIKLASCDLVLLLNSDVQLTPNYFQAQLPYFDQADTFGVQGRIVAFENDVLQDAAKFPLLKNGNIKATLNYLLEEPQGDQWIKTWFLSGANALVCREKLLKLNGFSELYSPFYFEDVDLSFRAWRNGWKCYYEHQSVCKHPNSVTIATYHKRRKVKRIAARNKLILHYIHLDGAARKKWKIALAAKFFASLFIGKLSFYGSFFGFLNRLNEAYPLRKAYLSKLRLSEINEEILAAIATTKYKTF